MPEYFWKNILTKGIPILCVYSVVQWLMLPLDSFFLWIAFNALMIWSAFRAWDKTFHPFLLVTWLLLVAVSSVVGVQYCRDYWDWKLLVSNICNYAICLMAFVAYNPEQLQAMFRQLYKYVWLLFVLLVMFLTADGISKFMLPFSFLALFYPLLGAKYRKMVWVALLITLIFGYAGRSDIIKFLFFIALGLFSVRHAVIVYIRRWFWLLYLLPFVLFILAANGTFNIFQLGSELNVEQRDGRFSTMDTRTLLYEEVISTAIDRGNIIYGSSLARGYESQWKIKNQDLSDVMGQEHYGERSDTESSVLNVFLHFGVIGLFVYLMIFFRASYLGIFESRNKFVPLIGLYVAFRFFMGWIEDFTRYDLNMFFLWAMIGICYSPQFREMTDDEFVEWFEGILA